MGRELLVYSEKEQTRVFLSTRLREANLSLQPVSCPYSTALAFTMDPAKSRKDVMPFLDSLLAGSSL